MVQQGLNDFKVQGIVDIIRIEFEHFIGYCLIRVIGLISQVKILARNPDTTVRIVIDRLFLPSIVLGNLRWTDKCRLLQLQEKTTTLVCLDTRNQMVGARLTVELVGLDEVLHLSQGRGHL